MQALRLCCHKIYETHTRPYIEDKFRNPQSRRQDRLNGRAIVAMDSIIERPLSVLPFLEKIPEIAHPEGILTSPSLNIKLFLLE